MCIMDLDRTSLGIEPLFRYLHRPYLREQRSRLLQRSYQLLTRSFGWRSMVWCYRAKQWSMRNQPGYLLQ
jgi:hypothetical protein